MASLLGSLSKRCIPRKQLLCRSVRSCGERRVAHPGTVYRQCLEPLQICVYPDPNLLLGRHRGHFRLYTQCADLSILSLKGSLVPRRGWPLRSSHPRQRFEIFGCLFDAELYRFQDNQDSHWNTLSALRLDIRFRPYRDFRIRVNRYALPCPDLRMAYRGSFSQSPDLSFLDHPLRESSPQRSLGPEPRTFGIGGASRRRHGRGHPPAPDEQGVGRAFPQKRVL